MINEGVRCCGSTYEIRGELGLLLWTASWYHNENHIWRSLFYVGSYYLNIFDRGTTIRSEV